MRNITLAISILLIFMVGTGCSKSTDEAYKAGANATNTYSCECVCDARSIGGFSNTKWKEYIYHRDGVSVLAKDQQKAKQVCAYECARTRKDEINKNIQFTATAVEIDSCEVKSVKLWGEGLGKSESGLQSIRPQTSTFEGPVDFGRSYIEVLTEDEDYFKVFVKGYVSISGGNCIGKTCDTTVNSVDLLSRKPSFLSSNKKIITNFRAINEGIWKGSKDASGTFAFGQDSKVSISGDIDGKHAILTTDPGSFVKGNLFTEGRITTSGIVQTNAFLINGNFVDGNVKIKIHLHIWLTNCQPEIKPEALCWGGIEQNSKHIRLTYKAKKLGYLKGGDLCAVINASDPDDICTAGGTVEFPTFACGSVPEPLPAEAVEISKYLKVSWRDSKGQVISNDPFPYLILSYMPQFPVSIVVENEWGRTATGIIKKAPTGTHCPLPQIDISGISGIIKKAPPEILSPLPQIDTGGISGQYLMDNLSHRTIVISHLSRFNYQIEEPSGSWPWGGTAVLDGSTIYGEAMFRSSLASMKIEGKLQSDGSISIQYIFMTDSQGNPVRDRVDNHVWYPSKH